MASVREGTDTTILPGSVILKPEKFQTRDFAIHSKSIDIKRVGNTVSINENLAYNNITALQEHPDSGKRDAEAIDRVGSKSLVFVYTPFPALEESKWNIPLPPDAIRLVSTTYNDNLGNVIYRWEYKWFIPNPGSYIYSLNVEIVPDGILFFLNEELPYIETYTITHPVYIFLGNPNGPPPNGPYGVDNFLVFPHGLPIHFVFSPHVLVGLIGGSYAVENLQQINNIALHGAGPIITARFSIRSIYDEGFSRYIGMPGVDFPENPLHSLSIATPPSSENPVVTLTINPIPGTALVGSPIGSVNLGGWGLLSTSLCLPIMQNLYDIKCGGSCSAPRFLYDQIRKKGVESLGLLDVNTIAEARQLRRGMQANFNIDGFTRYQHTDGYGNPIPLPSIITNFFDVDSERWNGFSAAGSISGNKPCTIFGSQTIWYTAKNKETYTSPVPLEIYQRGGGNQATPFIVDLGDISQKFSQKPFAMGITYRARSEENNYALAINGFDPTPSESGELYASPGFGFAWNSSNSPTTLNENEWLFSGRSSFSLAKNSNIIEDRIPFNKFYGDELIDLFMLAPVNLQNQYTKAVFNLCFLNERIKKLIKQKLKSAYDDLRTSGHFSIELSVKIEAEVRLSPDVLVLQALLPVFLERVQILGKQIVQDTLKLLKEKPAQNILLAMGSQEGVFINETEMKRYLGGFIVVNKDANGSFEDPDFYHKHFVIENITLYELAETSFDTPFEIWELNGNIITKHTYEDVIQNRIHFTNIIPVIATTTANFSFSNNPALAKKILYGLTNSYGSESLETDFFAGGSLELTDLTPGTTYHFKVQGRTVEDKHIETNDFTFTTGTTGNDRRVTFVQSYIFRPGGEPAIPLQVQLNGSELKLSGPGNSTGNGIHNNNINITADTDISLDINPISGSIGFSIAGTPGVGIVGFVFGTAISVYAFDGTQFPSDFKSTTLPSASGNLSIRWNASTHIFTIYFNNILQLTMNALTNALSATSQFNLSGGTIGGQPTDIRFDNFLLESNQQTVFSDNFTSVTLNPFWTINDVSLPTGQPLQSLFSWTTSLSVTSEIEWGITESYGNVAASGQPLGTNHGTVISSSLQADTTYHYRIKATTANNVIFYSGDFTFRYKSSNNVLFRGAFEISGTSVQISWTSTVATKGKIEYGLTEFYGSETTLEGFFMTNHQTTITSLTAGSTYHYRIVATDASNNVYTSENSVLSVSPVQQPDTLPGTHTLQLEPWVSLDTLQALRVFDLPDDYTDYEYKMPLIPEGNFPGAIIRIQRSLSENSGFIEVGTTKGAFFEDFVDAGQLYYYRLQEESSSEYVSLTVPASYTGVPKTVHPVTGEHLETDITTYRTPHASLNESSSQTINYTPKILTLNKTLNKLYLATTNFFYVLDAGNLFVSLSIENSNDAMFDFLEVDEIADRIYAYSSINHKLHILDSNGNLIVTIYDVFGILDICFDALKLYLLSHKSLIVMGKQGNIEKEIDIEFTKKYEKIYAIKNKDFNITERIDNSHFVLEDTEDGDIKNITVLDCIVFLSNTDDLPELSATITEIKNNNITIDMPALESIAIQGRMEFVTGGDIVTVFLVTETTTNKVIQVETDPISMINIDGTVYVLGRDSQQILVINPSLPEFDENNQPIDPVIKRIDTNFDPSFMIHDVTRGILYVICDNEILAVSTSDNTIKTEIAVSDISNAYLDSSLNRLFLVRSSKNDVVVVDTSTNILIDSRNPYDGISNIKVGQTPLSIDGNDNFVFTGNKSDKTISVIKKTNLVSAWANLSIDEEPIDMVANGNVLFVATTTKIRRLDSVDKDRIFISWRGETKETLSTFDGMFDGQFQNKDYFRNGDAQIIRKENMNEIVDIDTESNVPPNLVFPYLILQDNGKNKLLLANHATWLGYVSFFHCLTPQAVINPSIPSGQLISDAIEIPNKYLGTKTLTVTFKIVLPAGSILRIEVETSDDQNSWDLIGEILVSGNSINGNVKKYLRYITYFQAGNFMVVVNSKTKTTASGQTPILEELKITIK